MNVFDEVIRCFGELARIPRCSSDEGPVRRWLNEWAAAHSLRSTQDGAGNVRVDVPASAGRELESGLILQAHQDMVCVARNGISHDFARAGISFERDGDWLVARDTTLGADDGAGIALILGVCGNGLVSNPPLELLFTSNEESGMSGARGLTADFLRGRRLLNLDSEQEGSLTVGCAGIRLLDVTLPADRSSRVGKGADAVLATVRLDGLRGGHSAVDIHRGQANANTLLARLVKYLPSRVGADVVSWKSGSAPNMIPRTGELLFAVPAGEFERFRELTDAAAARFRAEYGATDPDLSLTCDVDSEPKRTRAPVTAATLQRMGGLILALPHGVMKIFDPPDAGSVRSSVNLAQVELADRELKVGLSLRGATKEDADEAQKQVEAVVGLAGGKCTTSGEYLPWRGKEGSVVRARAIHAYRKAFRAPIREEIAHGVLECGVISDRIPDMDMVSIGPTIENAHSPGERLSVSSLERVARFLVEFIRLPEHSAAHSRTH